MVALFRANGTAAGGHKGRPYELSNFSTPCYASSMTKNAPLIKRSPTRAESAQARRTLEAYHEQRDGERHARLDELVAENQRLGLYDD